MTEHASGLRVALSAWAIALGGALLGVQRTAAGDLAGTGFRALGVASYGAPLISTLLLIAFGQAEATWVVAVACVAIVGGAVLAARDLLFRAAKGMP